LVLPPPPPPAADVWLLPDIAGAFPSAGAWMVGCS
jgi:hypothetical protein